MGFFSWRFYLDEDYQYYLEVFRSRKRGKIEHFISPFSLRGLPAVCQVRPLKLKPSLVWPQWNLILCVRKHVLCLTLSLGELTPPANQNHTLVRIMTPVEWAYSMLHVSLHSTSMKILGGGSYHIPSSQMDKVRHRSQVDLPKVPRCWGQEKNHTVWSSPLSL